LVFLPQIGIVVGGDERGHIMRFALTRATFQQRLEFGKNLQSCLDLQGKIAIG
jgi:hypothetical protein